MHLFDIAKDLLLLDSTTPASNVGVDKTSDKASAKASVARRNSSDVAAAKTEKETDKQRPNGNNNRRRSSTSSTHLRKSSLMVDVMTGEFLDELLDDDGEDRNDKF